MNNGKKAWLIRIFAGGVIGTAFLYFVGAFFNALLHGGLGWGGPALLPVSPDLADLVGSKHLAAVIQFALYFALGAGIGVATLPFAEDGKQLFVRSALHFVYTAAVFSALVWLCWWNWGEWLVWLMELAALALVYLLIWGVRWVTWYAELRKLRRALGLKEQHGKKEE
ncbi:MAG: DUF3021 family protein [Oscillospiraceae bacterium]